MIKYVQQQNNKHLVGVEVGVWQGDNAISIMNNLSMDKLFLIDPFKNYRADNGRYFGKNRMLLNLIYTIVHVEPFGSSVQVIVKDSNKGIKDVPDDLDFVYLDGNKNTRFIREDIRIWYDKVKQGGVFGGHDYELDTVKMAVDGFFEKDKLFTKEHESHIDWWIVKEIN